MTIHAKLSASGSSRWMGCPGSVKAEEGLEDSSSPYADLGTVLHDIAEHMLTTSSNGREFVGKTHVVFDDNGDPYAEALVEDYHIDWLDNYVDFVNNLAGEDGDVLVEQRVDFSRWVPGGFGTADAVVLKNGVMYVIDLKTGKGNRVDAEENTQLMLYALGSWEKFDLLYDFNEIQMVIVQPPLDHISEWSLPVEDVLGWADNIVKPAAELALTEDAPRRAGADQCKWCKARSRCREYANETLKVVTHDFEGLETLEVKPFNELSDAEISGILKARKMIDGLVSACEDEASKVIMAGGDFPDFKLVEGRSLRKWRDEDEAEKALSRKLKVAERFTKKLISPAQAEKKLGKNHPLVDDLTVKPEGKPTLVPLSDKRDALTFNSVEDDFDGLESDAA